MEPVGIRPRFSIVPTCFYPLNMRTALSECVMVTKIMDRLFAAHGIRRETAQGPDDPVRHASSALERNQE